MSPISLAMDGLLAVLLLTAVAVGVRLNRKLKLLRDGQGQFVRAVGDLDTAAARAESGLQALRAATEEAHDALLSRIEAARGLLPKLDRAAEESAAAAARLEEGVRAADAAGRRAQAATQAAAQAAAQAATQAGARAADAVPGADVAPRPAPRVVEPAPRASAEPIPFPVAAREPGARGLAAALRAAERIVEAEAAPAEAQSANDADPVEPGFGRFASAPPTPAPSASGGDRLARFVARRRGARG